jgi:hypothetical protein
MSASVSFSFGSLAGGYCFSSPSQFASDLFALISGTVSVNGIVIGSSTPAVGDRDKAWFKLDSTGRLIGVATYLGAWLMPYPVPASGKERRMYAGADGAGDLWLYDGGDGTDPAGATDTSGSFWAIDHDFDFRIPMGPGTNGTSYDGNPATALTQGNNLGEERHTLIQGELPNISLGVLATAGTNAVWCASTATGAVVNGEGLGAAGVTNQPKALTEPMGSSLSHQNMPPVRGIYMIKRSARKFLVLG